MSLKSRRGGCEKNNNNIPTALGLCVERLVFRGCHSNRASKQDLDSSMARNDADKVPSAGNVNCNVLVETFRFFIPLVSLDPQVRSRALDFVIRAFRQQIWKMTSSNGSEGLFPLGTSPPPSTPTSPFELDLNKRNNVIEGLPMVLSMDYYLPNLMRLARNCPFPEIRDGFLKLLKELHDLGFAVPHPVGQGPSQFIGPKETVLPDTEDEQTQMLYREVFIQNNRLDHMSQVMAYHPKYLEAFLRTQHFILRADGPLPFNYRHYIGIMAAARHRCTYLINLQKQEFLLNGGDENWLKGLKHIPKKLQDLYEINKILGHRPWLIHKGHIEKLTKGADNWSLSELVHAIVILTHFHTLSCFVYGCGIYEEIDQENGHLLVSPSSKKDERSSSPDSEASGDSGTDSTVENGVEVLMQRMQQLAEQPHEEATHEEKIKRFETVESQAAGLPAGTVPLPKPSADISMFIEDPEYIYQDFAKRGELSDIPTFRVQDYSWDDHGYSLVNSIYNDVGNYLDEMFKITYNLTYYTMGTKKCIDTTVFRRAIWNYIQCMFGIRHDDYDYSEVNHMIERNLKTYIKTVCVFPERVAKKEYESIMKEFHHSEKVHVNLMVVEARMQAELLYALRAIMQYMT